MSSAPPPPRLVFSPPHRTVRPPTRHLPPSPLYSGISPFFFSKVPWRLDERYGRAFLPLGGGNSFSPCPFGSYPRRGVPPPPPPPLLFLRRRGFFFFQNPRGSFWPCGERLRRSFFLFFSREGRVFLSFPWVRTTGFFLSQRREREEILPLLPPFFPVFFRVSARCRRPTFPFSPEREAHPLPFLPFFFYLVFFTWNAGGTFPPFPSPIIRAVAPARLFFSFLLRHRPPAPRRASLLLTRTALSFPTSFVPFFSRGDSFPQ